MSEFAARREFFRSAADFAAPTLNFARPAIPAFPPSHSCEGRNLYRRKVAGHCTPSATVCAFRR
ncbi:MAG: hypothetical protein ACR2QC_03400 [Gammaproteobacteria bacterium]